MNKFFLFFTLGFLIIISACNNSDKNASDKEAVAINPADSLMKDIDESHMTAMSKTNKLDRMEKAVQQALDSLSKLPAKTQQAAASYKAGLQTVIGDLRSAKDGMEKWMDAFNPDTALNNMGQRIKYLTEEKLKVSAMKESILGSLQKADSILKAKL